MIGRQLDLTTVGGSELKEIFAVSTTPLLPMDQSAVVQLSAQAYLDCGTTLPISFLGTSPYTFEGWISFDGLCPDSTIVTKAGEFTFGVTGRKLYVQRTNQIMSLTSN